MKKVMPVSKIKSLFNEAYNHQKNFMTPNVIRYGVAGRYVYELSEGEGFGGTIYEVTVLTHQGDRRPDLSKCCQSIGEATEYVSTLRRLHE